MLHFTTAAASSLRQAHLMKAIAASAPTLRFLPYFFSCFAFAFLASAISSRVDFPNTDSFSSFFFFFFFFFLPLLSLLLLLLLLLELLPEPLSSPFFFFFFFFDPLRLRFLASFF